MEQHIPNRYADNQYAQANIDVGLREHMNKIYANMSLGLLITALAAWAVHAISFDTDQNGREYLTSTGAALLTGPMFWVIAFGPLAALLFMSFRFERLSSGSVRSILFGVAALIGVSLSALLSRFTGTSIASTFLITSISFGALSLWGYTTRKSLSSWGSFLFIGLVGVVIASIVNIFLMSSALAFAVSVIGILVFAGLTAYDTQNAKNSYLALRNAGAGAEELNKTAYLFALNLYLNFINMFQLLLNFTGQREE